ncbi:hypothetical protein ATANTOWER_021009 [Ataeniobius toweri]|uniref:Uncharacterized protein n=1 Tax=Ataeniobius toweri TaxID=208326 RepID=A0ABU7ASM0_9TELE|nr:hypothetical protein [Ataeniobius toweri]
MISLDSPDQITDSLPALHALPVHPPTLSTDWRSPLTSHTNLPVSVSVVCSLLPSLSIITRKSRSRKPDS